MIQELKDINMIYKESGNVSQSEESDVIEVQGELKAYDEFAKRLGII